MTYTKRQIADSVSSLMTNELASRAGDRKQKFAFCMTAKAVETNPDILDVFLDSPVVSGVVTCSDGEYDISAFIRALRSVLAEYDSYPVELPCIPVFAPDGGHVCITLADIDSLVSYLHGTASAGSMAE